MEIQVDLSPLYWLYPKDIDHLFIRYYIRTRIFHYFIIKWKKLLFMIDLIRYYIRTSVFHSCLKYKKRLSILFSIYRTVQVQVRSIETWGDFPFIRVWCLSIGRASRSASGWLCRKVREDSPNLGRFFKYVEDTWMANDVWPIGVWRAIRTNNDVEDVEGWHNRLNRRAKKGNLSMYVLLALLHDETVSIPSQVKLVKEGKLARFQSKRTTSIQGRLMGLWKQYNEQTISTSRFLRSCGGIYGPV